MTFEMERGLPLQNAALLDLLIRLRMALDHIQLLDDHLPGPPINGKDLSGLATLPAGDHHDRIAFSNSAFPKRLHNVPHSS